LIPDSAAALLDYFREGTQIAHDDGALASEALQNDDSNDAPRRYWKPGVLPVKRTLVDLSKQFAVSLIPQPILYRLWHLNRRWRPRTSLDNASDHRVISPQPGVRLEVYWADVPNVGRGPCGSLFVLREEVMRFDCFGGNQGHMHINADQISLVVGWDITPRLFFQPGSRQSHIDRAVFEVRENTIAALQSNQLARVRKFPLDRNALADASLQMKKYMHELMEAHGFTDEESPVPVSNSGSARRSESVTEGRR
jgi:hypothetical protein